MHRFVVLALAFDAAAAQLAGSLYNGGVSDPCARGLTSLYPFGAAAADQTGTPGDDVTAGSSVWVGTPFRFLGVDYNAFSFSTNGWLTFNSADPNTYVPVPFPAYSFPVRMRGDWATSSKWPAACHATYPSIPDVVGYRTLVDGSGVRAWDCHPRIYER